jgi:SAM-dependent methyltransferase
MTAEMMDPNTDTLRAAADYWDAHANHDPLWSILSDPAKTDGRWNLDEFMATGRREIALLWNDLARLGRLQAPSHALDFGCGVGRLTQALASRCGSVVGVDISARMLDHARQINQRPSVSFALLDPSGRIPGSSSFDFIYSNIVLQHVEPDISEAIIRQFCRRLAPHGCAVFQLPSHWETATDAQPTAMAEPAYAVEIVGIDTPTSLPRGARASVTARVRNISPSTWAQAATGVIRAGNHWLTPEGEMVVQDDGRGHVPNIVRAGEEFSTSFDITAPDAAGSYVLELDLVHEGITWFGDRRRSTWRGIVTVGAGEAIPSARDAAFPATPTPSAAASVAPWQPKLDGPSPGPLPMFAIPRERVLSIAQEEGRRVLSAEDDGRGRPEWASYRYYIV